MYVLGRFFGIGNEGESKSFIKTKIKFQKLFKSKMLK